MSLSLRSVPGIVLGLVLFGLVVGEVLEWPFLRRPLQDALSRSLQRPVTLDAPFGVRFVGSLRLRSSQLLIGPPQDAATQPELVRARDVRLTLPYATLWHAARGNTELGPVIDTLTVDHIEAHLLRDAAGRANWLLGKARPAEPDAPSPTLPKFGLLQIRSGAIDIEDAILQLTLRANVRTQEGTATDRSSPGPSGLQVQARGSYRGLPLIADLQSSGVLPWLSTGGSTRKTPLRLDARFGRAHLKLDGQAGDLLQLGGLDAAVALSGPSLAAVGDALGLTLPTTAAFDMRGRVRKDGSAWVADIASWHVGTSRLRGDFRYETASTPPLLTGTLAGERLALADLGPAIGTRTATAPESTGGAPPVDSAAGRVLPQREFDIPSLQRMSADVLLRLDRLDLGTDQIESLAPLQGRVRLQRGVLGVQELLARTASGTLRGEITVDARTPQAPQWRADLRWDGIELERFVKARNDNAAAATTTQRAPGYLSGTLGGSANVVGRGRSMAAVMATLDGKAGLWVRDGSVSHLITELAGLDIAEGLGVLIKGDERLPLRCAVTQWVLRDGTAKPETALIDTRDTTLLINGELSLAQESLALVVTAQPHDMSLFTLRAPLRINGRFAAPQVELDKSRIALRLAGAAALAALAPPAALLALVDLGEDDRQQCAEAVKRSQAARATPARRPTR